MGKANCEIKKIIDETVDKTLKALMENGRAIQVKDKREIYKATERRLYAYPDIKDRLETNDYDLHARSADVVKYIRGGRVPFDEKMEALKSAAEASRMRDQMEVEAIEKALSIIQDDEYYDVIPARYFRNEDDIDVAENMNCDESTIRRNRGRLVRRISVRLYGADAI